MVAGHSVIRCRDYPGFHSNPCAGIPDTSLTISNEWLRDVTETSLTMRNSATKGV